MHPPLAHEQHVDVERCAGRNGRCVHVRRSPRARAPARGAAHGGAPGVHPDDHVQVPLLVRRAAHGRVSYTGDRERAGPSDLSAATALRRVRAGRRCSIRGRGRPAPVASAMPAAPSAGRCGRRRGRRRPRSPEPACGRRGRRRRPRASASTASQTATTSDSSRLWLRADHDRGDDGDHAGVVDRLGDVVAGGRGRHVRLDVHVHLEGLGADPLVREHPVRREHPQPTDLDATGQRPWKIRQSGAFARAVFLGAEADACSRAGDAFFALADLLPSLGLALVLAPG